MIFESERLESLVKFVFLLHFKLIVLKLVHIVWNLFWEIELRLLLHSNLLKKWHHRGFLFVLNHNL